MHPHPQQCGAEEDTSVISDILAAVNKAMLLF
jgi:hypothetical protein